MGWADQKGRSYLMIQLPSQGQIREQIDAVRDTNDLQHAVRSILHEETTGQQARGCNMLAASWPDGFLTEFPLARL